MTSEDMRKALNKVSDDIETTIANKFAPGKSLVKEDSLPPQTDAMTVFLNQRRVQMDDMIADCEKVIKMCEKALG